MLGKPESTDRTDITERTDLMNRYTYSTQAQIRAAFWEAHPSFDHQAREAGIRSARQNQHCATVRCTFVDFVDTLARNGDISAALAARVTL